MDQNKEARPIPEEPLGFTLWDVRHGLSIWVKIPSGQHHWKVAAIGQEAQPLSGAGIPVANAAQMQGLGLPRLLAGQGYRPVCLDTLLAVLGERVDPMPGQIPLRPRDQGSSSLLQPEQSPKIDKGPVHDVSCTRLGHDQVQRSDIMPFPVGDMNEGGQRAAQVQ